MGLLTDIWGAAVDLYQYSLDEPYGPVGMVIVTYFWYWVYFGRS